MTQSLCFRQITLQSVGEEGRGETTEEYVLGGQSGEHRDSRVRGIRATSGCTGAVKSGWREW